MGELGREECLELFHLLVDRGHVCVGLDGFVELDDELRCCEDGALGLDVYGEGLDTVELQLVSWMGGKNKRYSPRDLP